MEPAIQKMQIQSLSAQLALSRETCSSLANKLQASKLSDGQKAAIAKNWYEALKNCQHLHEAIELLKRHQNDPEVSLA